MPNCRGSFDAQTQRLVTLKGNGTGNLYPCKVCGRYVAAISDGLFGWMPVSHSKPQTRRPSKGRNVKGVRGSGKALPPSRFKEPRSKRSLKRSVLKKSR